MDSAKPTATIVIPSYNHATYVAEAVGSLFRQTFREFEIIIIDDGSTDGSPKAISSALAQNPGLPVCFDVQENRGLSATLNRGLAMARGEFFGFLPSDDWYHPEKIERQVALFGRYPSLAVVFSRQHIVDEKGNSTNDQAILDWFDLDYISSFSFFPHLLERNFLAAPSALIRTELLKKAGGFDESLIYAQDHDLWLRLLEDREAAILHERLLYYRWHGRNLTYLETPRTREEKRYLLEKYVRSLTPFSKRVRENGTAMRGRLAASCVDDVEALLRIFDNATLRETGMPGGYDPEGNGRLLRDHIRLAEDRVFRMRNERQWLENERQRLLAENASLRKRMQEQEDARHAMDALPELLEGIHRLRGSRGYKLLRLLQIVRTGLFTKDVNRWPVFCRWLAGRLKGENTGFSLRPDLLAPVGRIAGLLGEPPESLEQQFSSPLPQPPVRPLTFRKTDPAGMMDLMGPALPLVSVLIPVYNHARLLPEAVESVLSQDYPHLELVILDDGSTDGMEDVLAGYAHHPCVRIHRWENRGLPRALTALHRLAAGEFITWTSADNVLEPFMVSRLFSSLLEHPRAVLAYGDTALMDEEGKPYTKGDYRGGNVDPDRPDVLRLPRDGSSLGTDPDNFINAAFLYRKEAVLALGGRFDHRLPGLEDFDFWLRMQAAGPFVHDGNEEPLYRYRVHTDTLSHRILTADGPAHYERTHALLEAHQRRSALCAARWKVRAHPGLAKEERESLKSACGRLPVDWVDAPSSHPEKTCLFLPPGLANDPGLPDLGAVVWVGPEALEPAAVESGLPRRTGITIPKGIVLPAQARRARKWNPSDEDGFREKAGGRPLVGVHLPPLDARWDVESVKRAVAACPDVFFVFLADPASKAVDAAISMAAGENSVFAGVETFGESYRFYAGWSAVWAPQSPYRGPFRDKLVRMCASLAHAIGVWLLVTENGPAPEWVPFVLPWRPEEDGSGPVRRVMEHLPPERVLDRYLDLWTPAGRMEQILALADASIQDTAAAPLIRIESPDASPSSLAGEPESPSPWPAPVKRHAPDPIVLQVDALCHGGLERVVVTLARELKKRGRAISVLCAGEQGPLAGELGDAGIETTFVGRDEQAYADFLRRTRPMVLNTHYSSFGLATASELGVPIVATIHNSYVWFTEEQWARERETFQRADRFTAVSSLVKEYYLRRMENVSPDRVDVVPNSLNPTLGSLPDRVEARSILGLGADDFVFLFPAAYDARKNQLGLLTAFDRAAENIPAARLLCAGEPLNSHYFTLVADHRLTLKNRERMDVRTFEPRIAALLAAADVLVVPSYFEGWSISATEALQAGAPLIHTLCGSARELCGDRRERGIVVSNPAGDPLALDRNMLYAVMYDPVPPNTDELAGAMVSMYEERREWRGRRKSLANYCRRSFSVEGFAGGYERVFAETAGAARGR